MCAVLATDCSKNNIPFVVCASYLSEGSFNGDDTALVAMTYESPNPKWKLTYNQLDSTALGFDLIDMVFDGRQIFVLNKQGNLASLFVVSADGAKVGQVMVGNEPLSIRGGCKMTVDRQHLHLFIATQDHMIHIYKINGVI